MSEERLVRPLLLEMKGPVKGEETDEIMPVSTIMEELSINCKEISIHIERRIQRTVIRGGEGDDLLDEGAESAVYDIEAEVSLSEYKSLMGLFRGGQPTIMDPFDSHEVKVAFKSVEYRASDGLLRMQLMEDVD
tara:strand:+ start:962 stop:1363 length:402 start_codon:yes stop_codon:yes gene_type:complete